MNTTELQDIYQRIFFSQENTNQIFLPSMIDDWLADELSQSGFIMNTPESEQDWNKSELPESPPISPSSTTPTTPTSSKSSQHGSIQSDISLFPDIIQQERQPKKKVLLPKSGTTITSNTFQPIAPRPMTIQQQQQPIIKKMMIPTVISPTQKQKRVLSEKEQEEIIVKRQKNTDAARRSRLKKVIKMEQLEQKVSDLESDNQELITRIAVLESEKSGLESKSSSYEDRIKILESQLAEAHKALTKI